MTSMKTWTVDLAVIGAGPAGVMAAVTAAGRGAEVTVFDPNPKVGKKLRITGKGRCNVTSDCEPAEFLKSVCSNPKFLKSALYAFPPSAAMEFFTAAGVPLKTERGQRVFPASDNANDIADALEREAKARGVRFIHDKVRAVLTSDGAVTGVRTDQGEYNARSVLISTGGLSYPGTGSTGFCPAPQPDVRSSTRTSAAQIHRFIVVPPVAVYLSCEHSILTEFDLLR